MNRVRLAFCVLACCGLSVMALAQDLTTVVTAAAPVERIRFAGSPTAVQMRIEVRSAGGALVYDSDWKYGNILDWLPQDGSGQPLGFGAYQLVMKSKNLAGQTSEKEAALHVDSGGMVVDGQPSASPKITLTAHDGETGQLITTSGGLSFRFGDFLNRKDTEAMRLTAAGELTVSGIVHAKGVMFSDGTILTTAEGLPGVQENEGAIRQRAAGSSGSAAAARSPRVAVVAPLPGPTLSSIGKPRPTASPDYQFKVDSVGVHIGTTTAFGLDVAGNVTLASNLLLPATSSASTGVIMLGSSPFAHRYGSGNTFLGANAGNFTTSGNNNTASGEGALSNVTTGNGNTASGTNALFSNTTGNQNTGFGESALNRNSSGAYNTAIGRDALYSNLNSSNTAIGDGALTNNIVGAFNTAVGDNALFFNTNGSTNIALGWQAGINLTTGNNNIDIGHTGFATEADTIRIGSTQTRTFIAGISGVTTPFSAAPVLIDGNGQLATAMSSRRYKFDINSMGALTDALMRLRPVTFRYLAHGDNAPLQYGLIAEEVAEVYPEMVTRNKDGGVETVMYQFLAPMLLNEVQKQHRQIEEQQKTIDALNTTFERLIQRVEQLEGMRAASQ